MVLSLVVSFWFCFSFVAVCSVRQVGVSSLMLFAVFVNDTITQL